MQTDHRWLCVRRKAFFFWLALLLGGMLFGQVANVSSAQTSAQTLPPTPQANAATTEVTESASSRPHVIVIMADDLGWSDLGCYGSEIATPHLDALASNGLRFTQFYNTGRCCPTRASLLTGLYPHQAGVGWMMEDNGYDGYRGDLNNRCATFAEVLGASGYQTYLAGKWHVTRHLPPDGSNHNWPTHRGFEQFYGTIHGAGSFWDPATLMDQDQPIAADLGDADPGLPYHYTDAIANRASRWIESHDSDEPLLMYVAFTAPHWPMHAHAKDIEKYRGRYDRGWDQVRAERHAKQIELGLVDPDWPLTDRDSSVLPWDEATDREWQASRMEVYAAMVEQMDRGVGKIVESLRQQKMLDQTLILFLADNGGCAEEMGSTGALVPDPQKEFVPEILAAGEPRFVARPQATRDGRPVRSGYGVVPGPDDTYTAYGLPWANVSNTPFRRYKHWVHEGGISSPLIVHWPSGMARRGELESQPAHLVDIMATLIDVAGADYGERLGDRELQPLEGVSLVPVLRGEAIDRGPIFWEHEGNRAVREGRWKLVADGPKGKWELYDIESDRTEIHDLASEMPERVNAMRELWERYAERANVLPLVPYRESEGERSEKRFELKQGDQLSQRESPNTTRSDVIIAGEVEFEEADFDQKPETMHGVIAAHGGSSHGYSLYMREGKLEFATRRNGELKVFTSSRSVPSSGFRFRLVYPRSGKIQLDINGEVEELGESPGAMLQHPQDGLDVGADTNGLIGDYSANNQWPGRVELVIEINR